MARTIRTERHTDGDGFPSKKIIIVTDEGHEIEIRLGRQEAIQLSSALKPNGRDFTITAR